MIGRIIQVIHDLACTSLFIKLRFVFTSLISLHHILLPGWACSHVSWLAGDEHPIILCAYSIIFDDLQYSRDLRKLYTTRTILQDVFRPRGNLPDVIPIISDVLRPFAIFCDLFILFSIFSCLYLTSYYINILTRHSTYYRTPSRCVSDLLRPFTDYIYLHTYRYSDVHLFIGLAD